MQLERVTVSPLNPFRKLRSKDLTLDHINAVISMIDVFRDERYKPNRTYVMPQRVLMDMPVKFYVRRADAEIRKIHIDFASTPTNIGHLELGDLRGAVEHITNRAGYTLRLDGGCPLGQGRAKAAFELTMNNDCRFAVQLKATNVNTSLLNGFIRPLVGMSSDCRIDSLQTSYSGNSVRSEGTFRMVYHDFSMLVHKEDDIPFEIITKHANSFTRIGNALVPKSNPLTKHGKPKGYHTEWTRNEKKPVELYLFGPILDGVKKTFLPGLYVRLRTKDGEIE